jgi:hypothetical protein
MMLTTNSTIGIVSVSTYVRELDEFDSMTFQTIHKKFDVAIIQLEEAIIAHKQGKYVVALALAGAAEEILGQMCVRLKIETSLSKLSSVQAMKQFDKPFEVLNGPKNAIKHASKLPNADDEFEIAEGDDFLMIVRALANLKSLSLTSTEVIEDFYQSITVAK